MGDTLAVDTLVFPDGADLDDWDNVRYWALHVRWRGPRDDTGRGGYAVTTQFPEEQLSRAGKWRTDVRPFQQRLFRWPTLQEAVAAARAAVDTFTTNGCTWAQYVQLAAERAQQESA